jgi:Signal transduction histidine kinase
MVEIVLFNLIENSVVFSMENKMVRPVISISVMQNEGEVFITIKDNGIGISPEVKEKVFLQFFRGTEKSQGSGLGLFLVQKALERLGGKIEIESEPYKETVVKVVLLK